jgi:His-Xaa-Ser system radical SAM maturase HxsC
MIKLHSKGNQPLSVIQHQKPFIAKVTTNCELPFGLRAKHALMMSGGDSIPDGFGLVLLGHDEPCQTPVNTLRLAPELRYIKDHDVVKFYPDIVKIDVLFRKEANTNSFLVTERCNSFCLMCSQPPKDIDDHYLVDDMLAALPLIHPDTHEIGITGGETTLVGDDFIRLIQAAKNHLPNTALHILSNGRNFKNLDLAVQVSKVKHPDVMIGIPLYADYSQLHDFIVQADDAFDDTIRGILNLKRCKVPVEIRVVIHQQNYHRLPRLAEFLVRNLLFVDHVALMGLELMGFAKSNLDGLWIDPYTYKNELKEAVETLTRHHIRTSIYNTPLCLIDESIRQYSVCSISDWKNDYLDICEGCSMKNSKCGGFFSSNLRKVSDHLHVI